MTTTTARRWLIRASLAATGAGFSFLLIAPVFHYPLTFDQALRILEILVPPFVGYLGAAVHYLVAPKPEPTVKGDNANLSLLVQGPVWVFGIALAAAFFAFGYSNRTGANAGAGMTVDQLAGAITAALAILTVSTGVLVNYLFQAEVAQQPAAKAGE